MSTLRDLRSKMTIVIVGHNLGAISLADRIVVMTDGTIREEGSHTELVRSGGIYSLLFSKEITRVK
jgi:ABC-type multidrug transport system fused ATPase/permease subunit